MQADAGELFKRPLVLVAEAEAALLTTLRKNLENHGFQVDEARDGDEALARIDQINPDLVLLDWMLPATTGLEVCRQIRRRGATRDLPVIIVTARTAAQDLVLALDTGADHCVTTPFGMEGLVARMRALLRRAAIKRGNAQPLTLRDVTMDLPSHRVLRNGRPLHLGPTEFRLLQFLLEHPDRIFSREELRDAVWRSSTKIDLHTVDVYIRRLRQSMNAPGEPNLVRTVRSAGYALISE